MGGPLGLLKPPTKPPQGYTSQGAKIFNVSAQIVFACTCGGYEVPMVIHLIPGMNSTPKCPACKTTFQLKEWMVENAGQEGMKAKIQVEGIPPTIIPPQ